VINMGISGNRVLREGAGSSGLARFDRDVLSRPAARWVLLLLGINDIGFSAIPGLPTSEKATAEDIIAGHRMLIAARDCTVSRSSVRRSCPLRA
jgi:lysophospholipase L1-like esterase